MIQIPTSGIKYIRVNRYDNNSQDIADNIRYARSIRVNHGANIRQYDILSAIVDPTDNGVYYLEVKPSYKGQPSGGTGLDAILVPAVNFDLDYNDYNALYSNANENQASRTKLVVERDALIGAPSNLLNIVERRERQAEIQDDFYEDTGLSNARFKGSRNVSTDINVFQSGDNAILQSPAVELTQEYFAYFEYIGGTSPEIVNKSAAQIKYLIGPNDVILDTSSDEAAVYLLNHNFESNKEVNVQLDDPDFGGKNMSILNGTQTVFKSGTSAIPILHNHAAAMPIDYANGDNTDKYSYFVILDSEVSGSRLYLNVSSGTWTANGTNWITGSSALFTSTVGGVDLYDTDFRQVGIGTAGNSGSIWDWTQSGELTEEEDYLLVPDTVDSVIVYNEATGYAGINNPYKILPNDRIIFHSQEYENWRVTYHILEVVKTASNIYLRVDRNVQSNQILENKFAIIRYVDNPKSVILNTNKPPGGTSGGIIKPKYVSPEAEDSIRATIKDMRQKGMI